jgi:V/A-type H+-transporting ATPase subunit A
MPLSAEVGPGLIGNTYDGIQRPLEWIKEKVGAFIKRGVKTAALPRDRKWVFNPQAKVGKKIIGGDILGTVKESELIEHRILVPPNVQGKLVKIPGKGE